MAKRKVGLHTSYRGKNRFCEFHLNTKQLSPRYKCRLALIIRNQSFQIADLAQKSKNGDINTYVYV